MIMHSSKHSIEIDGITPRTSQDSNDSYNDTSIIHRSSSRTRVIGERGYTCLSNSKKLQKECWKMREVHEKKMLELEHEYITGARSSRSVSFLDTKIKPRPRRRLKPEQIEEEKREFDIPPSNYFETLCSIETPATNINTFRSSRSFDSKKKDDISFVYSNPLPQSSSNTNITRNLPVESFRVSLKLSERKVGVDDNVSPEAFCIPRKPSERNSLPVIKSFTCLSRRSRKLKKEMKKMTNIINTELSSGTGMINDGNPDQVIEMDYLRGVSSRNLRIMMNDECEVGNYDII